MSEVLGWHFLKQDRRLRYGDGRLVEVGETLTVPDEPVLCSIGLHASRRLLDALQNAPGSVLCRVSVGGQIVEGDDNLAGQSRTVLAMADATEMLHEFACWCAEQALTRERQAGWEPDPRYWVAIDAKRRWLKGEIDDAELAAARAAAWAAAWAAARAAAWAAARDAAWDAARAAAWDAARAAAWDAAWDAAWAEMNTELELRSFDLLGIELEVNNG